MNLHITCLPRLCQKTVSNFCCCLSDLITNKRDLGDEKTINMLQSENFLKKWTYKTQKMRAESTFLGIYKSLYPYRGRIGRKQYNLAKPAKYDIYIRAYAMLKYPTHSLLCCIMESWQTRQWILCNRNGRTHKAFSGYFFWDIIKFLEEIFPLIDTLQVTHWQNGAYKNVFQ